MKKVTYTPKHEDFKGEIEISLPSARQRLRYVKECNFTFGNDGEVNVSSNIDALEKMYVIAEKHISKVDLKHRSGASFDNFNTMSEDSLCDEICEKIIGIVLQGSLGEA